MVYAYIEYAKSDRIRCLVCGEKIGLNEVRIGWHRSRYTPEDWHHIQCFIFAKRPFNDHAGHGRRGFKIEEIEGWEKMTESEIDTLRTVLAEWRGIRAKMILPKPISEMKGPELKLELKKRNLVINGKKPDFQQRLREYLATPWIEEEQKKQIDIQTSGYCRRFEKAIPFVLVEIIKSYGLTTGEFTL